jgi:archaellum biogenesis ATPase FlaH
MENSLLSNPIFKDRTFFPTKADKTPKVPHWKADALPAEKAAASWSNESHWAMPTGNGLLVIDVDTKNGGDEEEVYKLGFPRGTFRVKTPSGGCHLYYKDTGLNMRNSVQRLGKGIDVRTDGGYVCIPPMPGYQITCDHEPKLVLPFDLKLPAQPEEPDLVSYSGENEEEEIAEGSRNNTLFVLGSSLRARGFPEAAIAAALHATNKQTCNPPLPQSEVNTIVQQVLKFEQGEMNTPEGPRLRVMTAAAIEERDGEAIEVFLWKKHIPDRMPTLLYAEGGMGKTTLALLVCRDIMEADPEAKILWLPVENNMESTRIQMKPLNLDTERFLVLERETGGYSMDFSKTPDMSDLATLMKEYKPKIVVIDSLCSMSSTDVNSQAIKEVMKNLQDIICEQNKAALLYIHHENKSEGASARGKSMGSNMILAQVRMALRITAAGGAAGTRLVTAEKFNVSKPEPIQMIAKGSDFEIVAGGDEMDPEMEIDARYIIQKMFSKETKIRVGKVFGELREANVLVPQKVVFNIVKELGIALLPKDKNGTSWYEVEELLEDPDSDLQE